MGTSRDSSTALGEESAREREGPGRPSMSRQSTTSSLHSPIRHHQRYPSTPRQVKETLNARSEYSSSSDDGPWQHRINQYIIKQEIGRGSFGAVHLAVDQNGTEYAVKEFSKSRLRKRAQSHVLRQPPGLRRRAGHLGSGLGFNPPFPRPPASDRAKVAEAADSLNLIREEIAIMKKLNHPNLVALYEVLDDPAEDSLYMVLEMCKKGVVMRVGIDDRAEPYDEEQCRHFFRDLILGIEYLHAQGVVHRDIKPDNCLLTHDDVLKVVDFGVSEMFEKESEMLTAKSAGSPAFLPPELCVAKHGDISGKAADVWSMGVTLFCLRFGRIPFEKHGVLDLYNAIRSEDAPLDMDMNPDLRDLFLRVLEKDPTKRIKMRELRAHPWVTKGDADPLLSEEENTANLVEPPTEEEMMSAITGNFRHLLTVMRAVKRFKHLTRKDSDSSAPESFLGHSRRLVQPPLSMSPTTGKAPPRSQPEMDSGEPRPAEHAPEASDARVGEDPAQARDDQPSTAHSAHEADATQDDEDQEAPAKPSPDASQRAPPPAKDAAVIEHAGKGQAHDLSTEEPTVLDVGPGEPEEGVPHVISESPTGTDINIYETAYREAVERIRRDQGRAATVYLTRRVQGGAEDAARRGFTATSADGDRPKVRWGAILEKTKAMATFEKVIERATTSHGS